MGPGNDIRLQIINLKQPFGFPRGATEKHSPCCQGIENLNPDDATAIQAKLTVLSWWEGWRYCFYSVNESNTSLL